MRTDLGVSDIARCWVETRTTSIYRAADIHATSIDDRMGYRKMHQKMTPAKTKKQIIIDGHMMTHAELKQLSKADIRKLRLTHKFEVQAGDNVLTRLDPVAQAKQKAEKRQQRVQRIEKRQRRRRFLQRLFKWQDRRKSATSL